MSNARDLTGAEYQQLRDALKSAFPTPDELAHMVQFGLDENLYAIASGDLNNLAFALIRWARARGKTLLLIQAARDQNAGNERLRRFAEDFGLAPRAADLEKIVAERDPERFSDPDGWRARMARREQTVCRVEYGEFDPRGTGFLVGPDLLVTNYHVCEEVWLGQRPAKDVQFRFGYRKLANGQEQKGMTVKLAAKDWLVDHSPADNATGLDFVLVRLAKAVGEEDIDASNKALRRGWLTPRGYNFDGGETVFVIQHPKGWPIKFAAGTADPSDEHLITYRANTLPGSSGSPVFLNDWSLVALHHRAHETEANEGIVFAAILKKHPKVAETVAGAGTFNA